MHLNETPAASQADRPRGGAVTATGGAGPLSGQTAAGHPASPLPGPEDEPGAPPLAGTGGLPNGGSQALKVPDSLFVSQFSYLADAVPAKPGGPACTSLPQAVAPAAQRSVALSHPHFSSYADQVPAAPGGPSDTSQRELPTPTAHRPQAPEASHFSHYADEVLPANGGQTPADAALVYGLTATATDYAKVSDLHSHANPPDSDHPWLAAENWHRPPQANEAPSGGTAQAAAPVHDAPLTHEAKPTPEADSPHATADAAQQPQYGMPAHEQATQELGHYMANSEPGAHQDGLPAREATHAAHDTGHAAHDAGLTAHEPAREMHELAHGTSEPAHAAHEPAHAAHEPAAGTYAAPTEAGSAHHAEATHGAAVSSHGPDAAAPAAGAMHSDNEGSRLVIDQIDMAAQAGRARLRTQIEEGSSDITAAAAAQVTAVKSAGAAKQAEINTLFGKGHADVDSAVQQALGGLTVAAATQDTGLASWHAGAVAATTATFAKGQARAQKAGEQGAENASKAAQSSARKVEGKVQGYATQAHNIGKAKASAGGAQPEIASAKAQAAQKISSDAANKITSGLGDLTKKLYAMAPGVASSLRQKGQEAARAIATGSPQLVAHYGSLMSSAKKAMSGLVSKVRQSLGQLKTQVVTGLGAREKIVLAEVAKSVAKSVADLQSAGRDGAAAYRKQGAAAVRAGDEAVAGLKKKVAGNKMDTRTAAQAGAHIVGELHRGYDAVAVNARRPVDPAKSQLSGAGARAIGTLDQAVSQTNAQVGGAVGKTRAEATKVTTDVGAKLQATVGSVRTAGESVHRQAMTAIDTQVSEVDKAVAKGVSDLQQGLNAKVNEAEKKAETPLAQVSGNIDSAYAKIEANAHKSVVGKVLSWIGDQLKQLGNMLLDPGFWVGLLVVIVLIAFLPEELAGLALIAAMAAIGAVAAGIGTIVSNLAAGRPAFENVLQNMLIGAVFGGGLTFVAAALGTGIVGIASMMATAGVITVVSNLITGKPWDEGLLANILLVGVFASIAKLFTRPGAVKPAAEPKPGEMLAPEHPEPEPLPKPKNASGLPPELQPIYDGLSPKAQAQFEARWSKIAHDPQKPTPIEIDRMQKYLDAAKAKGDGDLSRGLEADYDKAHPTAGRPRGEAVDQLPGLRAKAEGLRARIEGTRDSSAKGTGYESLLSQLKGELDGPLARLENGSVEATNTAVQNVRANIEGIEAQFLAAQSETGVIGVGKQKEGGGRTADVDVVADNGARWVEVKNTEPFGLESNDWTGNARKQGLNAQADKLLQVARDPQNAVNGKPPEVVIRFTKGVSPEVAAALRAKGIHVIGTERPPVPPVPGRKDDDE